MAYAMSEKSIADRFFALDSLRRAKLDRARGCAALTLPELLPPYGWTETEQLEPPYSSVPARGVNALASRMMSALLPLNDMPFFRFGVPSGESLALEAKEYLESLSYQVFKKLTQKNLRETIYQALQQLLVLGDTLIILDDDMTFRTCRLDHYVVRRDYKGDVIEIIFLEHTAYSHDENAQNPVRSVIPGSSMVMKKGYDCLYHRVIWLDEEQEWHQTTELDGKIIAEGTYKISPLIPLRWQSIVGENYGRSHVECNIGDIKSLEAYTASLIEGLAAGSSFWMGVDPSGITALDDIIKPPSIYESVTTISNQETASPNLLQFGNSYHLIRYYRFPCKVVECNDDQTLILVHHTWILLCSNNADDNLQSVKQTLSNSFPLKLACEKLLSTNEAPFISASLRSHPEKSHPETTAPVKLTFVSEQSINLTPDRITPSKSNPSRSSSKQTFSIGDFNRIELSNSSRFIFQPL